MISLAFSGSRFPVGSSPMMMSGLWMSALAIPTRCASHPERVGTSASIFERSPTSVRTSGMRSAITLSEYPDTSMANATFSRTVRLSSNLKSWNTTPIFLRYNASSLLEREYRFFQESVMSEPDLGESSPTRVRMKLVLPLPLGPIRKTNSHFSIVQLISVRTERSVYRISVLMNCIEIFRDCIGKSLFSK